LNLAVAGCPSGLAIVRVAVNGLIPLGVKVTVTAVASWKSSFAGIASPVSFVMLGVAPDWKFVPRTTSWTAPPAPALLAATETIAGADVVGVGDEATRAGEAGAGEAGVGAEEDPPGPGGAGAGFSSLS